jgi:CheY-like chemotaxis protein
VFGFAKQSGGHLQLYSEPGTGTTARLYLPRTANPAEAAVLPAGDTPAGRGELVLVVEDDSSVRRVACSALVVLGYNVREAASADEALALLQAGARPSALFTDLIMPGRITARELATKARAMMPGIAVVFTSGYPQEFILREGALESGMAMISKPWRSRDLGRALYNALQASRGRLDRKQRRLLLVEDEPLVRMTTADALAELGFEVVEAEDGLRGLSRLQPPPDLLITDLGLPDIDGLELISRAREMVPGLPAVLTTGRSGRFDGDFVFLAKPYDGRELRAALNAALQVREVAG